jgi:hypothetical protein
MFWPMLHLALAFCGVAVLGVLGVLVGVRVRHFSLAVADSSERIARAAEELERAAVPLARQGGAAAAPARNEAENRR